ncbi:UDP-galactose transporter 2 [Dorcoceras hygrometricum]|uniref:UDP-galactose transporter 2 n=1 Tax=Dorcoceras hygrometricum TaxID=472368 RepID=A0A2Z7BVA6_9LAMI|nr:UDP-galactose transporter 2 [Dorcoceras hygrometricum]
MDDEGMIRMFKTLENSGLHGFLGVSGSVIEDALTQFFANATVISGEIVSTVAKRKLVITKEVFFETFHLPTEDIISFSELPTKSVANMKIIFSVTKVPFKNSSKKKGMKLSILLEKLVKADLGESVALHPLKVLNTKSVLTYLKKNQALVPTATDGSKPSRDKNSDTDKRPLEKLTISRTGGQATKRKIFLAPSDSESTISLSLPEIMKKLRTKRPRMMKPISTIQAESAAITADTKAATNSSPPSSHVKMIIEGAMAVKFVSPATTKDLLRVRKLFLSSSSRTQLRSIVCCIFKIFDQWHKFRTGFRQNKIRCMTLVEKMAKIEDSLFPWAEMEKVSEMLQRRELIWIKMVEQRMCKAVADHWKEFQKDKPSANRGLISIRVLEAELAQLNSLSSPSQIS